MNLLKSISVYTISNLSKQAIGFLLLPIITYYLSSEDNGDLSLISSIVALLSPLIMISAHGAINIEYFRKDQGEENFKSYLSSALINPIVLFFLVWLFVFSFKSHLAQILNLDQNWIITIPILCLTTIIPQVISIIYQTKKQPLNHAYYNISMTIIDLLSSIALIAFLQLSWEGRIIGNFGTKLLFSFLGLYLLKRSKLVTLNIKKAYIKDAFFYGLPLIPHLLASNIMDLSDRLFISNMISKEELGVYDIGYKIGSIMLIVQASLVMAWQPHFYEKLTNITFEGKKKLVRISYLMFGILVVAYLGLMLISPIIFKYFVLGTNFQAGFKYVSLVALSYVFSGLYKMFAIYIFYLKKNIYLSYIAVFNIIFNLSLNFYLIPIYGGMGAAYATLISYIGFFMITATVSHKLHPMPWIKALKN